MPRTSNKRRRAGYQHDAAGNQNCKSGSSHTQQTDGGRAPKLLKWSDTIQVVVGDDQIKASFHVPKQKLEEASFFKTAMQTMWMKDTIELKDDDPEIFNLFFNCLLSGNVPRIADDTEQLSVQYQWLRLYIFADKHLCAGLRNDNVTAFCQSPGALMAPDTEDFAFIAQSLGKSSHLLRLFCMAWGHAGLPSGDMTAELIMQAPKTACHVVPLLMTCKAKATRYPERHSICSFHDHDAGTEAACRWQSISVVFEDWHLRRQHTHRSRRWTAPKSR